MEWGIALLIFAGGVVSGIMNTVAGGGSLVTLPILIFAGLPAGVANGTNRLAIVLQNVTAVATFERKGVRFDRVAWRLNVPLLLGAAIGVLVAVRVDEATLRKVIGAVLLAMLIPMLRGGPRGAGAGTLVLRPWMWGVYFLIGIYGGFIQAGVGFLLLAMLAGVSGLDLVRANAVKVFLVLGFSVLALALFAAHGQFRLLPALALAAGNALGGWAGAHLAVEKGERWIRWTIAATVVASAIQLTGLGPLLLRLVRG